MSRTFVSVVCPTYNRRRFIPHMLSCFKNQDYSHDHMELVILDDGSDKIGDLVIASGLKNIRYIPLDEKINIGEKRNRLNREAKGDIIVCMDDDDYYPPERVSYVVKMFARNPKYEICGASEIYMYYSDIQKIYKLGPYAANHATNGTMAYRRSYLKTHKYDETVTHAEETSFLNKYTEPMLQLDPFKVMLVMAHSENTFDKKKMRENLNQYISLTSYDIKFFIKKNTEARNFFKTA
jgi:glycosyltransferase involved in cell wall biosynthesis